MLIHGITIRLFNKIDTGAVDAFNRPIYTEEAEDVGNVLVTPIGGDEQTDAMDLTGRRERYELSLPKGDQHEWVDREVEFWGKRWKTYGTPIEWMEDMVPLAWNKKVRVERIDGEG